MVQIKENKYTYKFRFLSMRLHFFIGIAFKERFCAWEALPTSASEAKWPICTPIKNWNRIPILNSLFYRCFFYHCGKTPILLAFVIRFFVTDKKLTPNPYIRAVALSKPLIVIRLSLHSSCLTLTQNKSRSLGTPIE